MDTIPAITIHQPWAWCILHAGKDIENRPWHYNYTGPVFVHAGKKFDIEGYNWLLGNTELLYIKFPEPHQYQIGGIVGIVDIDGYTRESKSRWFSGAPIGWVLKNARELPFIPYMGKQGIFYVPSALYEGIIC